MFNSETYSRFGRLFKRAISSQSLEEAGSVISTMVYEIINMLPDEYRVSIGSKLGILKDDPTEPKDEAGLKARIVELEKKCAFLHEEHDNACRATEQAEIKATKEAELRIAADKKIGERDTRLSELKTELENLKQLIGIRNGTIKEHEKTITHLHMEVQVAKKDADSVRQTRTELSQRMNIVEDRNKKLRQLLRNICSTGNIITLATYIGKAVDYLVEIGEVVDRRETSG